MSDAANQFSMDIVIPVFNGINALLRIEPHIQNWRQQWPDTVMVYIVNDGSTDGSGEYLKSMASEPGIKVIEHDRNRGRAATCNSGVFAGDSAYICFLDIDCTPTDGWIDDFKQAFSQGFDAVFGNLEGEGSGFWATYTNDVYQRRAQRSREGAEVFFPTAFCAFRRRHLEACRGFHEGYVVYGFEDMDLQQMLKNMTPLKTKFLEKTKAQHLAADSLMQIKAKMYNAGCYSSLVFRQRFPEVYQATQYWKVDALKYGKGLSFWLSCLTRFGDFCSPAIDRLLERRVVPYILRKKVAQLAIAGSYFGGTRNRLIKDDKGATSRSQQ